MLMRWLYVVSDLAWGILIASLWVNGDHVAAAAIGAGCAFNWGVRLMGWIAKKRVAEAFAASLSGRFVVPTSERGHGAPDLLLILTALLALAWPLAAPFAVLCAYASATNRLPWWVTVAAGVVAVASLVTYAVIRWWPR